MTDSANAAGGVPAGTTYNLVFVPGDGIGPEVIAAGRRVLEATGRIFGFGMAPKNQIHRRLYRFHAVKC